MVRTRALLLVAIVAVLLAATSPDSPPAVTARASDAAIVPVGSPLPGVGTSVETCAGGRRSSTRTSQGGCGRWLGSGPVNVVLLSLTGESPSVDTLLQSRPRWKTAQGGWVAARLATRGCGSGWKTSDSQIELRLDRVTRRHFKFIRPGCRFRGYWLTVGEAHTDLYEPRRCGGDHIADLDLARDALVQSLVAGGVVARLEYRQWVAPGTLFPDGCGSSVATDGRVAYLWLQS